MDNENTQINTLDSEHPWPGLRVFTEENASFFYGRKAEIEDLARMIRQETMTVLFGKSGLGKSSILRAGVSKELAKQNFVPIYIRLNHFDEATTLVSQVKSLITEIIEGKNIDAPLPEEHESVWEYFHRKEVSWWDEDNNLLKPVLIFDQFEEILTVGQSNSTRVEHCREFLSELEKLVENRPPDELLKKFKKEKGFAKNFDLERIDYRVVLSLREDYLADLESLRERLRSIMVNRYRLVAMNGKQAKEVIMGPGSHLVDEDVALKIIDFVSLRDVKDSEESDLAHIHQIEPALLSVILRELNNKRIELKEEKISSELITQNKPEEILSSFYHSAMKNMNENVRDLVEEQLLTSSGARNRVAEEDAVGKFGVSKNTISTLVDRRIIQRDRTGDITWLELNHDILTHVVASSAENRKRRKRIKKSLFYGTMSIGGVILLLGLGYLNQVQQRARQTEQAASLALDIAEYLEENSDIPALGKYRIFERLDVGFDQLRDFSGDTKKLLIEHAKFQVTMAETQFETGYYEHATEAAKKANEFIFKESTVGVSEVDPLLKAQIKLILAEAKYYIADVEGALEDIKLSKSFLEKVDTESIEIFLLSLKLDLLKARVYESNAYSTEALKIIDATVKVAEEHLLKFKSEETEPDKKHLQVLYEYIFKLYGTQAAISSQMNLHKSSVIYERYKKSLDEAEKLFEGSSKHKWNYFNSYGYRIKTNVHVEKGQISEALKSENLAIDILTNLVKTYENNLLYRNDLSRTLVKRAIYSQSEAPLQAKHDFQAAEDIANTIRRDTVHPYLPFTVGAGQIFYQKTSGAVGEDREAEFLKMRSMIDAYQDDFKESNFFDGFKFIQIYTELDSKDKTLEQTNHFVGQAIDLLDDMEARGADPLYLANRRFYLYQVLFQSKVSTSIEENALKTHHENAIKQVDFLISANPENSKWVYEKSRFLYRLANYYDSQRDYKKSYDQYLITMEETLKYPDKYIENPYVLRVLLYALQSMINSEVKIGEFKKLSEIETYWNRAEETIKSVYETADVKTKENDMEGFYVANQIFWNDIYDSLEKADDDIAADSDLKTRLKNLQEIANNNRDFYGRKSKLHAENISTKKLVYPDDIDWKSTKIESNNIGWPSDNVFFMPESYTYFEDQIPDILKPILEKAAEGSNVEITNIRYAPLSFYETGGLLSMSFRDENEAESINYYLLDTTNGQLYPLNGKSSPIHQANFDIPLNIKDLAGAAAYLRFFCTFIQDQSSWLIVESMNEIPWIEGVPLEAKQVVQGKLRPLKVWREEGDDKNWYATATVSYSNAIFYAKFRIEDTGMVHMLDDSAVIANLPVNNFTLSKGARSGNYTDRIYLNLIEDTKNGSISEEARLGFLLTLLADNSKKDVAYRKTVLEEAVNLVTLNKKIEPYKVITELQGIRSVLEEKNVSLESELESYLKQKEAEFLQNYIRQATEELNSIEKTSENHSQLTKHYLGISFNQLFLKDFEGSLKTSEDAIAYDPDYIPFYTNYAHALLLSGQEEKAREIYNKYDGEKIGSITWNEIILDDLEKLQKAGITHPAMDEIIEKLGSSPAEAAE